MRITSEAKTVRDLLSSKKYKLDYYQREYSWEAKHVSELITDLTQKFLSDYKEEHEREEVENYGHYFLGPIIINEKGTQQFIVDGQQRLTTLTLLLINLSHMFDDTDAKPNIADCIFSERYGKKSFNLDVQERARCMDALHKDEDFNVPGQPESVLNIVKRYNYIKHNLPKMLQKQALPYFVDWLLDNVSLATITVDTARDAYMIFETMNDRGLLLTPANMLRGYVLSNITDVERRDQASEVWQEGIQKLKQIGKDEESEAIKAWLRCQYAKDIRDFDKIGSEFHRWVREQESNLSITSSSDFANFIERDFDFYTRWYCRLREAANSLVSGLECVYYNAQNNFTLQYPTLLAPLHMDDSDEDILQKVQVVSRFLDIFIHRCIWNFQDIDQRSMVAPMFSIMCDIRGKKIDELKHILYTRLETQSLTFASNNLFHLYGRNRRKIHLTLARITDYVEVQSRQPSRYSEYVKTGSNSYEVEHI